MQENIIKEIIAGYENICKSPNRMSSLDKGKPEGVT